jgi:CRP/FNR family transcriptional regulator, cyclic AMP receptor protein
MAIQDAAILRDIPLFELLDDLELEALATQLDERNLISGQVLFRMGDPGGKMYVVQRGCIELYLQDNANERVTLGHVHTGGLFGELSLLDNQPRSASAKATEPTCLIEIDRNDLEFLVRVHPASALDMMGTLGERIRDSNALVRERVTARNVNEEMDEDTWGGRLADRLTAISGSMPFICFTALWFISWIVWNSGAISVLPVFDPFPFGLLTMIVSLEAIFLAQFVLISQNRQAARDHVRSDIEYEVNLKAELEIRGLQRQFEEMQDLLAQYVYQKEAVSPPPSAPITSSASANQRDALDEAMEVID